MLLGCIPLAFASAIVRYRLMDVEVIIKKAVVVAAVVVLLVVIYGAVLRVVSLTLGVDENRSSFWALLAMLVGALVAPWLWNAIQNGLDRLYYRDRYDYRKALVSFARELNSDLDLGRLSSRLVGRIRDTLAVDKIGAVPVRGRRRQRRVRRRRLGRLRRRPPAGDPARVGARRETRRRADDRDRRPAAAPALRRRRGGRVARRRSLQLRAVRVEGRDRLR